MKPRSDSRLFKLTHEQQAQLYDWQSARLPLNQKDYAMPSSPPDHPSHRHFQSIRSRVHPAPNLPGESTFPNVSI